MHAHLLRHNINTVNNGPTDPSQSTTALASVADIWYNPDATRNGRRSMPDLDPDDLNIIAVSTENGNVAYQRLASTSTNQSGKDDNGSTGKRGNNKNINAKNNLHDRPTAISVNGGSGSLNGSGGGGGSSSGGGGYKQKRSPIRTIQKKIFGGNLLHHGVTAASAAIGKSASAAAVSRDGNNNSMSTTNAISNNNMSVIINPLEVVKNPQQQQQQTIQNQSQSPSVESIRIKLHAGVGDLEDGVAEHELEEEEEAPSGQPLLSSSAPTGSVNFLVAPSSDDHQQLDPSSDGYEAAAELGDEDDDEGDDLEAEAEEECSVDKDVDEAMADMSLLDNHPATGGGNHSDYCGDYDDDGDEDEDSSWHQAGQNSGEGGSSGRRSGEDGRSSCDSMQICSESGAVTSSSRFVGDVNFIGDVMSEHDRTKNKKNYSLEGLKMKVGRRGKKKGSATVVKGQDLQREVKLDSSKTAKKQQQQQRLSGASKGSSDSGKSGNYLRYSDPTMSATKHTAADEEGMGELLSRSNINWEKSKRNVEILRENNKRRLKYFDKIHPLHSHMLLYYGVYDTKRVLHCLRTLRNLLGNEPRTFLCLTMTTSVADSHVKALLIR